MGQTPNPDPPAPAPAPAPEPTSAPAPAPAPASTPTQTEETPAWATKLQEQLTETNGYLARMAPPVEAPAPERSDELEVVLPPTPAEQPKKNPRAMKSVPARGFRRASK